MKSFLHKNTLFAVATGVLVLAAVVRGPHPLENRKLDFLLWMLLIAAVVAIAIYRFAAYVRMRDYDEWQQCLDELHVTRDVRADEGLYDLLSQMQWAAVLEALRAMPEGARSLRDAIRQVDPQAAV